MRDVSDELQDAMSDKDPHQAEVVGPCTSLCGSGSNDESCVALAPLACGGFTVGDNKPSGAGIELRSSKHELSAFAHAFVAEHGA